MKNRFLKISMITTLLVFMLVGCSGNTDNTTDTTELSTETVTDTESVVESELVQTTETINDNIETISSEGETAVEEELNYTEFNRVAHFRVANLPEKLINGEYTGNNSVFVKRYVEKTESGIWDFFYFKVWPAGAKQRVGLDLENMTDEEIGKYAQGTPNYDSLQRIETEDYYKVLIEYDATIDTQEANGYDLYINDKKTDQAYVIQVQRVGLLYDSAQMLSILESFELLE